MKKISASFRHLSKLAGFFAVLLLFCGCQKDELPAREQTLVQYSTIDALMNGVYDGEFPLDELLRHGDFGIGTFNALDGEMVLLDGIFYQVKADGKIYKPAGEIKTPFASVTFFNPETTEQLAEINYGELKTRLDSLTPTQNFFYAFRVRGNFNRVKTRSVPAQQRPYKPLAEVTAHQPEFEIQDVTGTLSGFYCPPYVAGINVPGYHLHFISDDQTSGGHVLEFELISGTLETDQINNFRLILPQEGDFLDSNLRQDLSEELEKVEGN